jgi:hypothetical protein
MRAILTIAVLLALLSSCKKNTVTPAKSSIIGYWTGTTAFYFSPNIAVLYRADGTARIYRTVTPPPIDTNATTTTKSEGLYVLKGDSVNADFPTALNFIIGFTYTGIINTQKNYMDGPIQTFSNSEYGSNSVEFFGRFTLTKK